MWPRTPRLVTVRLMRAPLEILVDYARRRSPRCGVAPDPMTVSQYQPPAPQIDVLALHDALSALAVPDTCLGGTSASIKSRRSVTSQIRPLDASGQSRCGCGD